MLMHVGFIIHYFPFTVGFKALQMTGDHGNGEGFTASEHRTITSLNAFFQMLYKHTLRLHRLHTYKLSYTLHMGFHLLAPSQAPQQMREPSGCGPSS